MNTRCVKTGFVVLVMMLALVVTGSADSVWTPIANAAALESFFVQSGVWSTLVPPSSIPVASQPAEQLPRSVVDNATAFTIRTLPESTTVAANNPNLSTAGDLYVWKEFSVYLLRQDCGHFNEFGYFTYKIEDDVVYVGEVGVIYPVVNNSSGPELGTGAKIVLEKDYENFVQVGFFIRNTRNGSWAYYENKPLSQTVFSVSEFNALPGKEWYNSAGRPMSATKPAREEFSYIFSDPIVREYFPMYDYPVMVAFEDAYWASSSDGFPSDWDYNDVVIVTDPTYRSVETNEVVISASISGLVWADDNQDGIRDDDEKVLDGITVQLLDGDGYVRGTTTTDINGAYTFTELEENTYFVQFVPDVEWVISPKWQGEDKTVDSDVYPDTARTDAIELKLGEQYVNVDMGVYGATADDLCESLGMATNFNALVFGNITVTGGDTEGRLAVGGDFVFGGVGYSVGVAIKGHLIPYLGNTADMLVINGDFHDNAQFLVNGNIVYGGNWYPVEGGGEKRYDGAGGNSMRHVPAPITFDADGNVMDDGTGYTFDYLRERLTLRSQMYNEKFPRGVVAQEPIDEGKGLLLVGNDPLLNVFHVTSDEWNTSHSEIRIEVPEGASVLVNITGEDIVLAHGRITLVGTEDEKVIYNYVNATNISVQSFDHEGSVLALNANVQMDGAGIDGHAVIGGDVVMTTGAEFHNFGFNGTICVTERFVPAQPSVDLSLILNAAPDGSILIVPEGTDVTNNYRIVNNGISYLSGVTLVDDQLGAIYSGGSDILAPGDSINISVVNMAEADAVYTATVTATPVSQIGDDVGLAALTALDSAALEIGIPPSTDPTLIPDFAIYSIEFTEGAPVSPGDNFHVRVIIANNGTAAGYPGALRLYENAPQTVDVDTPFDRVSNINEAMLDPGTSYAVDFAWLAAPADYGTYAIRAFVDALNAVAEWSEGDNQATLYYTLVDERPDFAILAIEFITEPTEPTQQFGLRVTVANRGDIGGEFGGIGFYTDQRAAFGDSPSQTPDASIWQSYFMEKDEVRDFEFTQIWAPADRGLYHVRAYVNYQQLGREWSWGDNELSLVCILQMPVLQAPSAENTPEEVSGYSIAWNAFEGDVYSVEVSTDLMADNAGFTVVEGDISLDGEGDNYRVIGDTIYYFDPNTYDGTAVYRVAFPKASAARSMNRSLKLK